jgi:tellurite methyltransferase
MTARELHREFGDIDVYLFDQLQRGRIERGMRILDAGCGTGRNLSYMMNVGFDVWGVDQDAGAIEKLRARASEIAPTLPGERFQVAAVERMPFADSQFDFVISSAVLHFAGDERQWRAMVDEMWRVLAPGGTLFARLASTVGHETRVRPLGNRRFVMPDGETRFLVDDEYLIAATAALGGSLADPIKTTVVHAMRSMSTWVVARNA